MWSPRIVLAFVAVSCAPAPAPQTVSISSPPPSQTAAPAPVSSNHAPERSDTVRVDKTIRFAGDCEWRIIEAREAGKKLPANVDGEEEAHSDGHYVLVHFELTNVGAKDAMLSERPKIIDQKLREFGTIEHESLYVPAHEHALGLEALHPRTLRTYWAVFELPDDAAHQLKLAVHGFVAGNQAAVELGL
jgi:hypothetical protein